LVPGTPWRIGLDPFLGLIPGWGDALTTLAHFFIPYCAIRVKCPKPIILRMFFNIACDSLISLVPVIGDLFDFAFKANRRNARLLNDWWEQRSKQDL
jgi:hypothetical protein